MTLNENEKRILSIIQQNPFVSQQDLADALEIPRPTVASIISSLIDKHIIKGRGYILHEEKKEIFCIGGMNIDRKYSIIGDFVPGTSNPVHSEVFVGGVVRNIAENLGRLGQIPQMISVAGQDQGFDFIKMQSEPYVRFDYVKPYEGYSTGSYSAILDETGEMQLGLADMDVYQVMTESWIKSYAAALEQAKLIVVDLNVSLEVVQFLIAFCRQRAIDLVIIPVSGPKMAHLPQDLTGVKWLIVNQDETEAYFQESIQNDADADRLVGRWLEVGVENVIMTRGPQPSVFKNQAGQSGLFTPPQLETVVDVTGAGDSYSSAIIFGHLMDYPIEDTVQLAMTNSYYTIQSDSTVRLDLNHETLIKQKNDLFEKGN